MTVPPVLLMIVGALCAVMGAVAWHFIRRELIGSGAPPSVAPAPSSQPVPASGPSPSSAAPAAPVVSPEEEEARVFAVIAAAVAAVIREPHLILGYHPVVKVKTEHHVVHPWSSEGRRAQFSSHRIR